MLSLAYQPLQTVVLVQQQAC